MRLLRTSHFGHWQVLYTRQTAVYDVRTYTYIGSRYSYRYLYYITHGYELCIAVYNSSEINKPSRLDGQKYNNNYYIVHKIQLIIYTHEPVYIHNIISIGKYIGT